MQKPEQVSAAWAVVIFATDQMAWPRPESSDCPGRSPGFASEHVFGVGGGT